LEHEQMRGWYAFDEGGKSGSGGWGRVRTTWSGDVAMPHGWAIAEVWLLLRDCLLFEDGDRLVLFGGVRPEWFKSAKGMEIASAPTYFGDCSVKYSYDGMKNEGTMDIKGTAKPGGGFVLRLPAAMGATVTVGGPTAPWGRKIEREANGDFVIPCNTAKARIEFSAADSQIRRGGIL
jgi:hypothetical protein